MRLVSWNVAGRVQRMPEQAAALVAVQPDLVALQEVTTTTLPRWRAALAEAGLPHTACPLDEARPPRPRRLAVLTASRAPIERVAIEGLPWPERAVAVRLGDVELVNAHSPIAPSPGLAKVLTHEALFAHLRDRAPAVLCGDLNTPRRDLPGGEVLTFACDTKGRLREERGPRWDAAERALVHTLRTQHGWTDPFVASGTQARTWTFADDRGGWRLDHVLTRGVPVGAHAYAHEWRRAGLSDHAAVVADLAL